MPAENNLHFQVRLSLFIIRDALFIGTVEQPNNVFKYDQISILNKDNSIFLMLLLDLVYKRCQLRVSWWIKNIIWWNARCKVSAQCAFCGNNSKSACNRRISSRVVSYVPVDSAAAFCRRTSAMWLRTSNAWNTVWNITLQRHQMTFIEDPDRPPNALARVDIDLFMAPPLRAYS